LTEFSSAELDRLLADARATLEEMRADRPTPSGDGAPTRAVGAAADGGGGRVRATAEHGRLTAVEFAPEALELTPEKLGNLVVTAVNAALDGLRPAPVPPPADASPSTSSGKPGGADPQEQGLWQMERLTQAINEALGRIG
jgi:hypothetical protein